MCFHIPPSYHSSHETSHQEIHKHSSLIPLHTLKLDTIKHKFEEVEHTISDSISSFKAILTLLMSDVQKMLSHNDPNWKSAGMKLKVHVDELQQRIIEMKQTRKSINDCIQGNFNHEIPHHVQWLHDAHKHAADLAIHIQNMFSKLAAQTMVKTKDIGASHDHTGTFYAY
jgi:hypothetical protein